MRGLMTWTSDTCAANGIRIHYTRTGGARPPVVLLHGLMGSGACWTPLARALAGDFDVIMPDARGHGGSSAPLTGYRYDDLADDVVALVAALGLVRPVVLGHSMGGMTAAVVASRPVELRGLILVDPTFLSPERQREVHASDVAGQHRRTLGLTKADLIAQSLARSPHRARELVELQAEARLRTSLDAFAVLAPPNPDYRALIRTLAAPAMLVIGDDPVVTPAMAADLRDLHPPLQLAEIADAGHGLPFDQPDRLAEVVLRFLRTLAP